MAEIGSKMARRVPAMFELMVHAIFVVLKTVRVTGGPVHPGNFVRGQERNAWTFFF